MIPRRLRGVLFLVAGAAMMMAASADPIFVLGLSFTMLGLAVMASHGD